MTSRSHPRAGRSLKRKVATRRPRKTVMVFCEGERSEPEYLQALKRESVVRETASVDLRVDTNHGGSVPMTLVRRAVKARRRAESEDGEIDEFWCVFDVEWPTNHPDLKNAIDLARRNGIHLAISNPCFELWLILHFADHGSWLDNDAARQVRRGHDGQTGKGLNASVYMPLRAIAAERARRLDNRHDRNGTEFPQNNPSSGMYLLLTSVQERPKD